AVLARLASRRGPIVYFPPRRVQDRHGAAETGTMALRRFVLSILAVAAIGGLSADSSGAATVPGSLDSSFANYSTVAVGTWAAAAATLVQPDGRIVTAGEAS